MPQRRIDITGQRFGSLVVTECYTRKLPSGKTESRVRLRCDCGAESDRSRYRAKKSVMCNECAKKLCAQQHQDANKAVVGRRQGSLTIIAREGTVSTCVRYTVRCDCGAVYKTRAEKFNGRTACWDCHMKRVSPQMDRDKGTNSHNQCIRWREMIRRCYDERKDNFKYYGAVGVTVCDRWRGKREQGQKFGSIDGFHNFLEDMGEPPSPAHSIDRIDPYGNYEPSNCRWATPQEQTHNQRHKVDSVHTCR